MNDSGWFWCTVLFFVPAAAIAGSGWWARRTGHSDSGPVVSRPWLVATQVVLALSLVPAVLLAGQWMWAAEFPVALVPLGLIALTVSNWWLLLARPRWAAIGLAATGVVLPFAVGWTAWRFVVDPHEVPPGPNSATIFMFTALVVVVYCIPALIASLLAMKAQPASADPSLV